jgi:hypothetical protein
VEGWPQRGRARRAQEEATVKEGFLFLIAFVLMSIGAELSAIRHDLDVIAKHVTDGGVE